MGLSLFSGGSKKNQTTNNTTAATGYGSLEGDKSSLVAGLVAKDGGTISITQDSHGAIEAGRELALRAIDAQEGAFAALFEGQREQTAATLALATTAQQSDAEDSAVEFRKLAMILGAVVAVVFVAPLMFKRG